MPEDAASAVGKASGNGRVAAILRYPV